MKKWLAILLSQNSLRKVLGFNLYFKTFKFNYHREVVEKFAFKKVLIISPHPDDDIFGVGGTIVKLTEGGADVAVAYLCNGEGGVKEENVARKDLTLIETRKSEAKRAGEILGVKEQLFYDYPDGKLSASRVAVKAVSNLIKNFKPDIIFLPSFLDNHPDHRAANDVLIKAVADLGGFEGEIWAYEVWTPISPNRVVPINNEIESKRSACEAHKSQLDSRGYTDAIIGLNQYRAEINNIKGYAEAFFASKFDVYKKLYEANK